MSITVEMLQRLSTGAIVAAAVFFVAAVILFFLLDIPKVLGDITGATARKEIENIRQQNEQSGDKAYKSSPVNKRRGKITDKISPSGQLIQRETNPYGVSVGTADLESRPEPGSADETTVLDAGNEEPEYYDADYTPQEDETGNSFEEAEEYTYYQEDGNNDVRSEAESQDTYGFGDTTVLSSNETTVLGEDTGESETTENEYCVIDEIGYSSSQEIIE